MSSSTDPSILTPVEKRGDYWFKRDDLFQPFPEPLNGSKVRQCLSLLTENRDKIRKECGGTVATVSSVNSPQGYLIARCASSLGFKTVIGIGNADPERVVETYPPFQRAVEELGAKVLKLAGIGFNSILHNRLVKMSEERHWFPIIFGIGGGGSCNADQVQNLPDDLDNLVIPCGSGITTRSLLTGIAKHKKRENRPRKIWIVQIAGIHRDLPFVVPHQLVLDNTYPYHKKVRVEYEGLELDSVYEAKAFHWAIRKRLQGKTLFYVIGNFNSIREGRE